MSATVRYSPTALKDLERVWADVFAASRDTDLTRTYLSELMDRVESYAGFPRSASPLYYENRFTGYYYVVFKAYLAFFRAESDQLLVDRVLYGKSDYLRTLLG
ncbi:MAG: type II toxin-antitoxin system RelE/ParE family toxin [Lachnospiraceae bacterium]|nr:type II toxin-antitoxin system RelE/ParE family toxin [Lachnospiraceae bacterium]